MLTPQLLLDISRELVVDLFAGGGGASTGIEQALDRHVDVAVNHDREAVALHQVNHPQTKHYVSDVFEVNPLEVTEGRPVGLLWASPDCKHFSKAKGGKPVSKKIRGLAWVVVKWARAVRPRVICLENVEEFVTWGPLGDDNRPCPRRKGLHHGEVRAFLVKYYGTDQDPQLLDPLHTVTTKDRFGLVTVAGEPYAIVDIGLRMLSPRELYRAQGFPETYGIEVGVDPFTGERINLTKTAQVRMCGNSVCPPLARAIVAANYHEQVQLEEAA